MKREIKKGFVRVALALCVSVMMAGCASEKENDGGSSETESVEAVVVSSTEDFLDAIEPGAVIEFKKGTYNLSPDLAEIYGTDGKKFNKNHEYVQLEECYDGIQIVIKDVDGLTIKGQDGKNIELQVEPRYADVLTFDGCEDITLSNMTMGHTTEQGECEGDVLELRDCDGVNLEGMDMYGCGAYGITASNTSGINVTDSTIHDCSYGLIWFDDCDKANFKNCNITGIEGYGVISAFSSNITFNKCSFEDNNCSYGFVTLDSSNKIAFKACTFGEAESGSVNGGDLGDDSVSFDGKCTFADFVPGQSGDGAYVYYSDGTIDTPQEILEAIEEGGEVYIEDGYYNLSDYIENVDMYDWNDNHSYVKIEEVYDGKMVVIYEANNLGIYSKSGKAENCEIVIDPRYAEIFQFISSENVTMAGITMGHTDMGSCAGDVLEFSYCKDVTLENMDLYGCGVYGISTDNSGDIYVNGTCIHDCEFGPASLFTRTGNIVFTDCLFENNSGGFWIGHSKYQVYFNNCTFGDYETTSVLYNSDVVINSCALGDILYYPENAMGGADDYDLVDVDVEDFLSSNYYYESYWDAMEATDGEEAILLPLYDEEDDKFYYSCLGIELDGTGYIKGLYDFDIVEFEWEISNNGSYMILTEIEQDGFTGMDGEAYLYFCVDGTSTYVEFARLEINDMTIYYHLSY